MPIGAPSAAFQAAVQSLGYARAVKFTITLPVLGLVDFTGNVVDLNPTENDTSSYPFDLADTSGISNWAGTVTLAGSVTVGGVAYSVTRLFNADDQGSPLWRSRSVAGSPMVLSLGAYTTTGGVTGPEFVDRPGFVVAVDPNVEQGTVAVD